ncbi:phage tail spike protein [Weissella confusa]|uniref:phage tail spike protein n=1 Tax=Weissella confusa TaxID=1583 RepID=UPI0014366F52|nr:phage tail spike protein [Weissella confusa]MBJ7633929.1 hypothetical protein [Weissella confusa]
MTPILYSSDEIDFLNNGLGQLGDLYDVDIHEQRNGLLNLTAYYPVNGQHYADISEGNIILAKPSPLDDNHAFRIVSVALDITGYAVMIEADSITYDLTNNLSKTIHMLGDGQAAMTAIQKSTLHPHIFTFYSDITHTSESQLRYVNPMEAIAGTQGSFLQIWGGELKRENRRVAMFNRRGRDNVATFRLGKNIAGLKYTVDVSNLTTEIVPTVTVNSTDVSRTIEGATVQSSRMGNYPLVYSKMVDVSQDVKVDEGDTDDQIKARINAFAADWFVKSANTGKDLPEVTVEVEVESLQDSADYADKFAKLETIGLTDTVTVYVPEFGVNVTAIVNELHYDPIDERVTSLVVGTAKVSFADSNKSALSDLENKVTQVQEQATQAVTSANGKNKIYPGRTKPEHPQEGDTWFWEDGENSGIKVFKNGDWVDVVDSKTQERITNEVKNAVDTAAAYADKLNSTQAEATNSLADELAEKADELTKSQQKIANQATAYTNSAVADANARATTIGQTTAQNAQKALDNAKRDLSNSIASEASARSQAVSSTNSLAQSYANQAKSDAISAAATADGVIRKDFKDTTDGLVSTITQNKKTADDGISTAQSTAKQALDGLQTKVSQTEYDAKTGKLQTDLTETMQTANQAKTDIVSIKQKDGEQDQKMNSIVSDVNSTKQTISDLKTEQGKQSGSISKLEQRADGFDATVTKVNNLSIGGRNLLLNTKKLSFVTGNNTATTTTKVSYDSDTNMWHITSPKGGSVNSGIFFSQTGNLSNPIIKGQQWAFSFDIKGSGVYSQFGVEASSPFNKLSGNVPSDWTRVSSTGIATGNNSIIIYFNSVNVPLDVYIKLPKLETGNQPTDWTPAPEDLSSATAKAQLTADNATLSINNYKTDADGRISKAQTDIQANATAISQKVSQTVFDQKTGDLTTKVTNAQQTADNATQTIGRYQTSNDNRVKIAETNIKANADAIKLTASKTDLDNATGKLSGSISELKQQADGFDATVTKVNNLSIGGRNYVLNSSGLKATNDARPTLIGSKSDIGRANISYDDDGIVLTNSNSATNEATSEWFYGVANAWTPFGENIKNDNTVYTFSADVKGTAKQAALRVGYNGTGGKEIIQFTNINNDVWTRVSIVVSFPTTANGFFFRIQGGLNNQVFNRWSGGEYIKFRKVQIEQGNVATDWKPAQEDTDTQLAQVKLTADGIYQTVNDPKTGLNTRVSTAEGNFEQIKSNVNGLSTTVTKTSDGLTQEIKDRTQGDDNTLKAGKDFTTSQISSYDTGMQTRLSQTSDAIMAAVSGVNLFTFSRFEDSGNNKWPGSRQVNGTITKWEYFDSGNNGISVTSNDAWQGFWHSNIPVYPGQVLSSSVMMNNSGRNDDLGKLDIWFVDHSGKRISQAGSTGIGSASGWVMAKIENIKVPSGAAHMQVSLLNKTAGGPVHYALPMVNVGSKALPYTPDISGQTALQLFSDSFALSLKDNIGNIISGINGDTSGLMLTGKHIFLDGQVTAVGKSWLDGAVIKDATIGRAQIADLSVDSSKIINLDVNKITGNVANFIRAYWDGRYGSTSIDSDGMTITAGLATTTFDKDGMKFEKSSRSVGRIGVNDLYQDFSKKGLYFGLESTGDFMAWGAQNYAGNPYTTKLSWFRAGAVPSNLPGLIEGFNFEDNVAFINPVEMRGGIKLQGANDRLLVRASNLNGGSYPTFGGPSAYFVYAGSDIYLSSNGTAINLTKIAKAFGGIRTAALPTGFNSNGTATGWYNVDMG